jgi:hypothetical protein
MVTVTFHGRREGWTGPCYDITEKFDTNPMLDLQRWLKEAYARGYEVEGLVEIVS